MRVLAIDFGDKRIGLAVSDGLNITAQALGQYLVQNEQEDKEYFQELIARYKICEIVIGLPLRMDGTSGARVQKTKEFALWLEEALNLPIKFWDERLTTKQALRILDQQNIKGRKKKKYKDQISATIILSCYLESKRVKPNATENN